MLRLPAAGWAAAKDTQQCSDGHRSKGELPEDVHGCRAPSLRMLRRLKAWHLMEGKANGYKSKDGALLAMESGAPVSPAWGGEGLQAWVGHDLTVLSAWDWSSVQC